MGKWENGDNEDNSVCEDHYLQSHKSLLDMNPVWRKTGEKNDGWFFSSRFMGEKIKR